MSNLSHAIRRFNRFELKYILTIQEAERLKKALRSYMVPDDHGNGSYILDSLYYDSPDLRFFWEKMDGVRFRRKLRIRHYEDGQPLRGESIVFLEIKQRIDRVTQKRRVPLSYEEALRFCNNRERPDGEAQDKSLLDEIEVMLWQYNLRPVSLVRYQRQALIGTDYDLGLRITFDTALGYSTANLRMDEEPSPLPMLPADRVVMEIKVNERIPYWLTEHVAAHNLKLVRVSKYCRSIELAHNHHSALWLMESI